MNKIDKESYARGFISAFLLTKEGFNAEYGHLGGMDWNYDLDSERKMQLKRLLRELALNTLDAEKTEVLP